METLDTADLKVAVMLNNLKMDPYEGMKVVAVLGAPGMHLSARQGRTPSATFAERSNS